MPMHIIMQEKRKEIGYTQKQVAEYLGVSAPAVNKWEKGTTSPDIALLPPLARLLKVDLNTLLCFQEGLSEQEIARFGKEIADTIRESGFEKGFAMGMQKIKEYPDCSSLLQNTALLLEGSMILYGLNSKEKESYAEEIQSLYERVAKSGDTRGDVRNGAIFMLASKYIGQEKYEKAQEMLDLMPERSAMDKRVLQAKLWRKEGNTAKAAELLERNLLSTVNEIQSTLLSLIDIEASEADYQKVRQLAELSQNTAIAFELGDYYASVAPLQAALLEKNMEKSLQMLESTFEAMLSSWKIGKTSLYRHIPEREEQGKILEHLLPSLLSEIESDPTFSFLAANAEFLKLIAKYRKKAASI